MAAKIRKGDKVIVLNAATRAGPAKCSRCVHRQQGAGSRRQPGEASPEADAGAEGGIISKEAPIHLSNIAIVGKDGKPTRVGFKIQKDGTKVRIAKRSGAEIDG